MLFECMSCTGRVVSSRRSGVSMTTKIRLLLSGKGAVLGLGRVSCAYIGTAHFVSVVATRIQEGRLCTYCVDAAAFISRSTLFCETQNMMFISTCVDWCPKRTAVSSQTFLRGSCQPLSFILLLAHFAFAFVWLPTVKRFSRSNVVLKYPPPSSKN